MNKQINIKTTDEKPFSLSEAAIYLGFSKSFLYKLTSEKKIPFYKPNGKLLFFSRSELNAWVFKNKSKSKYKSNTKVQNAKH